MKQFLGLSLITIVHSLSIERIQQAATQLQASLIQSNPDFQLSGPGLRSGGGQTFEQAIIDITSGVKDYGCYCHFGETIIDTRSGKGEPIDQFDSFCKALYHGYKCLVIDDVDNSCNEKMEFTEVEDIEVNFPASGRVQDACNVDFANPDNGICGTYTINNLYKSCNDMNLETGSGHSNDFNCSVSSCLADMTFAGSWFTLMMDEFLKAQFSLTLNFLNPDHYHDNGFDTDAACIKKATHQVFNQDCCGVYPYRFPYGRENNRECCVDKTYDSRFLQCCADGVAKLVC